MNDLPTAAVAALAPQSGGSAAGRAYREELEQQRRLRGEAPVLEIASTQSKVAPKGVVAEARAAERKKVTGRAKVALPGNAVANAKMIDISLTGACVLMEDALPGKRVFALEFDIYHLGTRYVFAAQAVSVYSVLASGKGFKVGFQFGQRNPEAQSAIAALVA